jgi:GNAT superfamily N-acetyltransferase
VEIRLAEVQDVAAYAAIARAAQAWLQSRGLEQYVPAAHDEYADAVRARAESGKLYAVWDGSEPVAFFSLEAAASPWWPADEEPALYLSGMIVSRHARGRGIGSQIIQWSLTEAARRKCRFVRLDCHADNPWLCMYYQSHGFILRGRVEQHPGYMGCMYERQLHMNDDAKYSRAKSDRF